jgi:outer membrane protein
MKKLIPAFALIVLSGATAFAQDAKAPIIGVIDLQRVTAESQLGQGLAARVQALQQGLEKDRDAKQQALQTQQAEIEGLKEELNKQRSVLSQAAIEGKLAELRKKERDAQAFVEDGQRELQLQEEQANRQAQQAQEEYREKLKPHIDAAATARGIDILLDRGIALYVKPEFDISADVVAKVNAAEGGTPAAPQP